MIPKIIHYCWLSGEAFPEHIEKCINSWKSVLPDYEFMLWDYRRFPRGESVWVDQAFDHHKYAFAADYIRLYALYHWGGFYLDADVEVLQSFNPFLELDTMICWQKDVPGLEVAALGVSQQSEWVRKCLDYYENRPFIKGDGTFDIEVLPEIVERILQDNQFDLIDIQSISEASSINGKRNIPVFPSDFFSPKSYITKQVSTTANSVCIHHFDGSWKKKEWYEEWDEQINRLARRDIDLLQRVIKRWRKWTLKHQ